MWWKLLFHAKQNQHFYKQIVISVWQELRLNVVHQLCSQDRLQETSRHFIDPMSTIPFTIIKIIIKIIHNVMCSQQKSKHCNHLHVNARLLENFLYLIPYLSRNCMSTECKACLSCLFGCSSIEIEIQKEWLHCVILCQCELHFKLFMRFTHHWKVWTHTKSII